MPIESAPPLPEPCVVLKVMRSRCNCDQKQLARLLQISQRALSRIERNYGGNSVARELLVRAAQVMNRPASFVEETFSYVRRTKCSQPRELEDFDAKVEIVAERAGAGYRRFIRESSLAAGEETLLAAERAVADKLWRFYVALPDETRQVTVESEAFFHRWGFAERLWLESLNAAADSADRALALGELALAVAERIDETPAFRSRVVGLATSAIANARRVKGQLLLADRDLAVAKKHWQQGAADGSSWLDEARFLALEATLRRYQRRFPEALDCMDQAFRSAKPGSDITYLLISKGNLLFQLQRHEEAAALFQAAVTMIEPSVSERQILVTRFNLAACFCSLGRPEKAEDQLPEIREGALALGNGLDLLRVRWLEGQIQAGFGRRLEAIETLEVVRDDFLRRDILFDAALATLERVKVQLEVGQIPEVKAEAPALAETFRNLRVAPELLASLMLFFGAAEAERATAEDARLVLSQLRQSGLVQAPVA